VALLPHLGTPAQFEAVRRLLRNLQYDEESVCRRAGISTIFEFKKLDHGRETATSLNDGLDALIRLFLDAMPLPEARLRYLLPMETVSALESLGLVIQMGRQGDFFGTVRLAPVESVYISSDRYPPLDPEMILDGRDIVFDPLSWNTGDFLKHLPRAECGTMLDLCTGSGVAALLASGWARRVWACDLTSRSVRFAEFNRDLNGIVNVACMQGDLYEPVRDLTFDRIVAHPPYVPAEQELLLGDAGEDGEQVLRPMVEGLPRHLRGGGLFYAFVMAADRQGQTLEDRICKWLGPNADEFHVAVEVIGNAAIEPYEKAADRPNTTAPYFAALSIDRGAAPGL
jgi:SAM-dependent methyltransferase